MHKQSSHNEPANKQKEKKIGQVDEGVKSEPKKEPNQMESRAAGMAPVLRIAFKV